MKTNQMKTIEFIEKYNPCEEGLEFAMGYETMTEVWENCERPDWLFWILKTHKPLMEKQSVRLVIAFAESSLYYVSEGEDRPRHAVEAAKTCLENPTNGNRAAARAAYSAAYSAASAAYSAAASAAYSAAALAASAASAAADAAADADADADASADASAADADADAADADADAAALAASAAAYAAALAASTGALAAITGALQCGIIRGLVGNPF